MHFEILAEDLSGKRCLEILFPQLRGPNDTFRIISYKGVGRIPKSMKANTDPHKRILLANLPRLLRGYGNTFNGYGSDYEAVVIIVCDLDGRNASGFLEELEALLEECNPQPDTRFCLAIEEGEAWLLGDFPAVKAAYPGAKDGVLSAYVNDSICGTWERLADAVYPGGANALSRKGWQNVGAEKFKWAEDICPRMDIEANHSPSFCSFRDTIRSLRSTTRIARPTELTARR